MRLAKLAIPAQPEFVSLARLVISSVASGRYELSDDRLDDLKLAVSEACVLAIGNVQPSDPIVVRCEGYEDRLAVSVTGAYAIADEESVSSHEATNDGVAFGMPLIATLVDHLDIVPSPDGEQLRLTITCLPL